MQEIEHGLWPQNNNPLKTDDIKTLEIVFDSGSIPPPFCHIFNLKVTLSEGEMKSSLNLQYTHREELTEEEIINEGFTLNDDYSYEGDLPKVWEKPVKSLLATSKWHLGELEEEEGGIMVIASDSQGSTERKIPNNQQEWQLLAQDLIQAIYELSKKEAPLRINYLSIGPNASKEVALTMEFAQRKAYALVNGKNKDLNWEKTKELMGDVFLPDYDYDKAREQKPTKKGVFIDCGDGFWHEFGKGIYNIDPSYDALGRIKEAFNQL